MATLTQEFDGDKSQSITDTIPLSTGANFFDQVNDGTVDGTTNNRNPNDEKSCWVRYELANIPSDFGDLSGGSDKIDFKGNFSSTGYSNDTMTMYATIETTGGTAISDRVQVATDATSGAVTVELTTITEGSLADTIVLFLEWIYAKTGGPDNAVTQFRDGELFWTYTIAVPSTDPESGHIYYFN